MTLYGPETNGRIVLPWDRKVFRAHADLASKYDIVDRQPVYKDGELTAVVIYVRPKRNGLRKNSPRGPR